MWRPRAKLDEGRVAAVGFVEAVEGLVVFVVFLCSCTIRKAEGLLGSDEAAVDEGKAQHRWHAAAGEVKHSLSAWSVRVRLALRVVWWRD